MSHQLPPPNLTVQLPGPAVVPNIVYHQMMTRSRYRTITESWAPQCVNRGHQLDRNFTEADNANAVVRQRR